MLQDLKVYIGHCGCFVAFRQMLTPRREIVSIFHWIKMFSCTKCRGRVVEPMYFSWHNMPSASYTTFEAVQLVQEVRMGQLCNVQVGFLRFLLANCWSVQGLGLTRQMLGSSCCFKIQLYIWTSSFNSHDGQWPIRECRIKAAEED